jgi:peroxiredoxin
MVAQRLRSSLPVITEDFTNSLQLGAPAPSFSLTATDGSTVGLADLASRFVVLIFTCNHCPYVLGCDDRLERLIASLAGADVRFVGICSNDGSAYPQHNFERMGERAARLPYLYLHDPDQSVARAYGAQLTPEFFVLERRGEGHTLRWHGSIDDSPRHPGQRSCDYLRPALRALLGEEPLDRTVSPIQGCSIKWL